MDWSWFFLLVFGVPLLSLMIRLLLIRRIVVRLFENLNRHDLSKFIAPWRSEGVYVYPGDLPVSGTSRGKGTIEGWFRNFLNQFPLVTFTIQDICFRSPAISHGKDKTKQSQTQWSETVAVHYTLQLTNRGGRTGYNSGVMIIGIVGAFKIVLMKDFIFDLGENFRRDWGLVAGKGADGYGSEGNSSTVAPGTTKSSAS